MATTLHIATVANSDEDYHNVLGAYATHSEAQCAVTDWFVAQGVALEDNLHVSNDSGPVTHFWCNSNDCLSGMVTPVAAPAAAPTARAGNGAVARCRELATQHATRAPYMAAAKEAGINPATAATQWQLARKGS